jgi:Uma2 family endonuclease
MRTAIKNKGYTYEDYPKTPDNIRYELIEGDLVMAPSPETRHQRIVGRLFVNIFTYVKEHNSGEGSLFRHLMYILIMKMLFSRTFYLYQRRGLIL